MSVSYEQIAKLIDHSLLSPTLREEELRQGCRLAVELRVASVCIMPFFLAECSDILSGSGVEPSTTIGFPHGANATQIKVSEARRALSDGATELDMVINVSKLKSGDFSYVKEDIRAVLDATREGNAKLKVIFETCMLERDEKVRLCDICSELRVDWVKTSTGFGGAGATEDDVELLRRHSHQDVQVKASGGIRELSAILKFRELGATRCGTSRSGDILKEFKQRFGTRA
jgi:deoxyribose-phosphate aldolase